MEIENCSVCLVDYEKSKSPVQLQNKSDKSTGIKASTLKSQVAVIYLVHSILDVPLEECTKYLVKYGNPSDWVTLCPSCSDTLEDAQGLGHQISKLQNQLEILQRNMRNQMRIKIEDPRGPVDDEQGQKWLTATYEIRQYVSYSHIQDPMENVQKHFEYPECIEPSPAPKFNSEVKPDEPMVMLETVVTVLKEEPEFEFEFEGSLSPSPKSATGSDSEWEPVDKPSSDWENRNNEDTKTAMEGQVKDYLEDVEGSSISITRTTRSRKRMFAFQPEDNHCSEEDPLEEEKPISKSSNEGKKRRPYKRRGKHKNISARRKKGRNKARVKVSISESESDSDSTSVSVNKKKRGRQPKQLEPEVPSQCEQCTESFPTKKDLRIHIRMNHTTGYKCNACNINMGSLNSLEDHVRGSHKPPEVSTCSGCNQKIPNFYKVQEHCKQNPECREKAVSCNICSKFFTTKESLELHVELRHNKPPQTTIVCPTCNKSFSHRQRLSRHIAEHHSGQRPFICEKCGKSFAVAIRLKEHIQNIHLNKEPDGQKFPCKTCGRVFTNNKLLGRHEKLHGDDAPYLCTVCGKRYKVGNQLTTHMWSHDPDRHKKYSLYMKKDSSANKIKRTKVFAEERGVSNSVVNQIPNPAAVNTTSLNMNIGNSSSPLQSDISPIPDYTSMIANTPASTTMSTFDDHLRAVRPDLDGSLLQFQYRPIITIQPYSDSTNLGLDSGCP